MFYLAFPSSYFELVKLLLSSFQPMFKVLIVTIHLFLFIALTQCEGNTKFKAKPRATVHHIYCFTRLLKALLSLRVALSASPDIHGEQTRRWNRTSALPEAWTDVRRFKRTQGNPSRCNCSCVTLSSPLRLHWRKEFLPCTLRRQSMQILLELHYTSLNKLAAGHR